MNETALALQPSAIQTMDQMESAAGKLAASGLMGKNTTPEMVFGLMLLCQCEGLNPIAAMKRYHIVEGRPSMRADAMQAEFIAHGGAIIWHVRTDEMVAATLFADKSILDDAARTRAAGRFEAMWQLDCEMDDAKRPKLMVAVSKFSREGEETIIRTFADCDAKGITRGANGVKANWKSSPRQMLTARVITEGVRLVNPGLIAGIYSEDETADIARQEAEARQRLIEAPSTGDIDAIMGIITDYDQQLRQDLSDSRRKSIQGARADLVCKLHDLGVKAPAQPEAPAPTVGGQPAQMVEAVAAPEMPVEPAQAKPAPKPRAAKPTQQPTEPETSWVEVECHVGPAGGRVFGKKLGAIFATTDTIGKLDALVGWFSKQSLATSPELKDQALWKAVQEGAEVTKGLLTKGTSQTPATEPAKAKVAPAPVEGWRGYVIESKNVAINGKKLGELSLDDIQGISDNYLAQVNWANATLVQKALKANVALALAELLPPAANSEPDHTQEMRFAIEGERLTKSDFFKVCHANEWIDARTTRIEDITEAEVTQILGEWTEVCKAVRAEMPQVKGVE